MNRQNVQMDHINFSVDDLEASIKWYTEIFDFQVMERGSHLKGYDWAILKSGGAMLAISEQKGRQVYRGDRYHRTFHFALSLTDQKLWRETKEKHKVQDVHGHAIEYPFSTSWYVLDPTGHEIEVVFWNTEGPRFP